MTDVDLIRRLERLEALVAERDAQIAARDAQIAELLAENSRLKRRVAELEELLKQDSSNSGKPPSSDTPEARRERRKRATKRRKTSNKKRGGQPGHRGSQRELVPVEQVDEVVRCRPTSCRRCEAELPSQLAVEDVRRDQVFELPELKPLVIEYQLERLTCPCCAAQTEGCRPDDAPPGGYGPRLTAFVAMLTGVYHLGRRRAVALLRDGLGVRMSLGAVSSCERRVGEALAAAHDAARKHVAEADTRYVDATTWYSGSVHTAVWVVATVAITLVAVTARSTRAALMSIVGRVTGRVVCDRATVFDCWSGSQRQTCWAHLLRYFEAMAARDGPSSEIGSQLCMLTLTMFSAWHDVKKGKLTHGAFKDALRTPPEPDTEPFVHHFRHWLVQGSECDNPKTAGTCRNLLQNHWDEMWTFLDHEGVEPTNNHAEQEIRPAVLWRKRSFGTQSDRGDRFVERILTAARSLRKQSRHLHTFLVDSLQASWQGTEPPSILPRDQTTP